MRLGCVIFVCLFSLTFGQNISVSDIYVNSSHKLVTVIVKLAQQDISITSVYNSSVLTTTKPISSTLPPNEEYWLRTVISVPIWVDVKDANFRDDIQKRFVKVIELAVERQQAKRYKLPENQQDNGVKENVQVQVLNISREGTSNRVNVIYAVTFNGYYIGALSLSDDLKLVSSNEFSAYMGYPVQQINSYVVPEQQEKQNWWIIGAVIGSTVGVLMCGWCLLFVYYNTCGRAFHQEVTGKKIPNQNEKPSSPVLKISHENEPRETSKIYLISTDVQTDLNDDEELIRSTQPTNWVVPLPSISQRVPNLPRQPSLQLSTSFDNNQGITQLNQAQKPITLPTNSTVTNNKNVHRRSSYMNGLNSPQASDSVGSTTLKTNEEVQTIGISADQEQKYAEQRFVVDQSTLGGVSGFGITTGISPLASYGIGPSRNAESNPVEDIWTLYPFQRYQAADTIHRLTEQLTSDHPRPSPSSTFGEILMHSKEFQPKRLQPAELSKVFGLI